MIRDTIQAIEGFAKSQPDYPVYDILESQATYQQLKEDSDRLAAYLSEQDLSEKFPLVVFGGQDYHMLASFVGMTKSGHASIPIDSHSSHERIKGILEVAQPELIVAKNHKVQNLLAFPILKDGVRERNDRDIDMTKAIKTSLLTIKMPYMIPSKFIYRDDLPKTANGKNDMKSLINEVNS